MTLLDTLIFAKTESLEFTSSFSAIPSSLVILIAGIFDILSKEAVPIEFILPKSS